MHKFMRAGVLLIVTLATTFGQEVEVIGPNYSQIEHEHTQWIDHVMRSIATIKPGMTRGDLPRVFTEEGGVSTRTRRRYVYKHCPYIKVDIDFFPSDDMRDESLDDKIITISRPFLEYSIMD
jgi:hypothetical protein